MIQRIFISLINAISDRAFSLYVNFLTILVSIWFVISLFFRDLNHSIITFLVFAFFTAFLHYMNFKFKNRQTFFSIFLEFTVFPAMLALILILLLLVNAQLIKIPQVTLNIITITVLLISVTIISYIQVRFNRKKELYLKLIRVILDYAEAVYWVAFSVILFIFVNDGSSQSSSSLLNPQTTNTIKLFILPFMIQTRVIKAYIGYLLQKIEIKKTRMSRSVRL